jgi:hypothetical protein
MADLANAWYGAAFSPDGRNLFVSGGTDDRVMRFDFRDGALTNPTTVTLRADTRTTRTKAWYPSGTAIDAGGRYGYAAAQFHNRLYKMDLSRPDKPAKVLAAFDSPHAYPYKVVLHPREPVAYVSLWGAKAVAEVRLRDGAVRLVATDSHPNEMVISRDGTRLFVACANTNLTDVIDTRRRKVVERLDSALYPNMPAGSTPNALALSPDGNTLLIANADNNNLAVFDVSEAGNAEAVGYIPTGWYPTAVAFTPAGDIAVVNAKGDGSLANPDGPNPADSRRREKSRQYIGGLLRGSLSFVDKPDKKALWQYTRNAYQCSPLRGDLQPVPPEPGNPIPARVGDPSPIRYCVYIIKENRTYDQVLGDMPEGNGDPKLCLFPEKVTPNHHAIAREFVLFDNFYVESEVSADGHEWSTGAYATDYVEKTWPAGYGNHGKIDYPAEGMNPLGDPDAGHIWDRAKEAGISYRSYGEWVEKGGPKCDGRTSDKALQGHIDPCYSGYNLEISDVDHRAKRFLEELGRFEREGELPRLVIIRLPNDHTAGTAKGKPTPRAYMAQNDLALGMILEGLSKSKFWKQMAVFVVEDDAQNGPDHVDAHRTIAFVAGPHVKRSHVCHQVFSTASMLRTMELILGLKPMSQFDAAARPLYACFTPTPDFTPYTAKSATWPLGEMNPDGAPMQHRSAQLNLEREDSNPDVLFNEIIWKSVRGADSEMPAPVRAAFVRPRGEREGADD